MADVLTDDRRQFPDRPIAGKVHKELVILNNGELSNCPFHELRKQPQVRGVYFVRWYKFVKVGMSDDIFRRINGIWWSLPWGALEPLGYIPHESDTGTCSINELEGRAHTALERVTTRGEWYRDCGTVRRYIAEHALPWPKELSGGLWEWAYRETPTR